MRWGYEWKAGFLQLIAELIWYVPMVPVYVSQRPKNDPQYLPKEPAMSTILSLDMARCGLI